MKVAWLAAAVLSLAAAAAPAQEWQGVWAADPAWCSNADSIGEAENAPISLTAEALHGLENRCEITDASPLGVGASWRLDLKCTGEGTVYRASELVLLRQDGTLVRYTDEGFTIAMVRCQ